MKKEESNNQKLFHDYALEPELVAECNRFLYRYLTQKKEFGWDTGCMVIQYPKKWKERAWKAFKANSGKSNTYRKKGHFTDLLRLIQLGQPRIHRSNSVWDHQCTWLENAEVENTRHPFHAILARENPRQQSNVDLTRFCGYLISN